MEYPTRQHATVRLVGRLSVLFFLVFTLGHTACKPDAPETDTTELVDKPNDNTTALSKSPGTVIDETGVPSMIDGKRVTRVEQVDGGIEPYQGNDPIGDGRQMAMDEVKADITGFAGISPCDCIKTQDLEGWPGGIGNAQSERNNMGDVVLGCIISFQKDGSRPAGNISLYFSNNQSPELAAESVQLMPNTSKGATLINDWDKPAAYDPTTGEFVWSHKQTFLTLVISHPSVKNDHLKWSQKLASAIESRMP